MADQQIFTTAGAAAFVGVTRRTIERWREDGTLRPAYRTAGNHSRYTRRQLEPLRREYADRDERGQPERDPAFPWNK